VAYLFVFEQIGVDFSGAFGSVVVFVLEFWHGNHTHLVCAILCKLKAQCLLPPGLAAGLLQSLDVFSEPDLSEIWWQQISRFLPRPDVITVPLTLNFQTMLSMLSLGTCSAFAMFFF